MSIDAIDTLPSTLLASWYRGRSWNGCVSGISDPSKMVLKLTYSEYSEYSEYSA
jgi:hypothetical protein